MTIYPGARYRPVSGLEKDPPITPVGIILHVRDGEGSSLFDYFDGLSRGIESHWYIDYKGNVEQYRDSLREADANYHGNSWIKNGKRYGFHSVETEGLEKGEWTTAQLIALKQLIRWDAKVHNFPLQRANAWNGTGVGYHTMWGAPSQWTPHRKTCPGPKRIRQFNSILIPWMTATVKSDKEVSNEMTPDDWKKMEALIDKKIADLPQKLWSYKNTELENVDAYRVLRSTRDAVNGQPPAKKIG